MRLDVRAHTLALAQPLRTSYGVVHERELLVVSVTDADGVSGHGEAAPLPAYDGVEIERVQRALAHYREVLASRNSRAGSTHEELLAACRRADPLPQALAGLDMALWDREGRLRGAPVAALLTAAPRRRVRVNALVTASEPDQALAQAEAAARQGFGCVKVKVGVDDDDERVAAVRAGGGATMELRLDANGAWDVDQAERALSTLASARLELVEEPVSGLEAVRELRARVSVRIAIDETAALDGALGSGAADAVCLKLSRCGGIAGLLAAARAVRASGASPYVSSTFDGPLGIAASLHAAAAIAAEGEMPHCGLATLGLFAGLEDPLPVREGAIAVPAGAGLGVDPL